MRKIKHEIGYTLGNGELKAIQPRKNFVATYEYAKHCTVQRSRHAARNLILMAALLAGLWLVGQVLSLVPVHHPHRPQPAVISTRAAV